jgi:hypothetical protein
VPTQRSGEIVTVEGLDEFRKALKQLGPEWTKELGKANKEAGEIVAKGAVAKADSLGGVARHVAPSIKSSAQARQAVVSMGGASFPMALGAEFGAKRYPQFGPFRGNQWEGDGGPGYVLDPTVKEKAAEFESVYLASIDRLAKRAFPK